MSLRDNFLIFAAVAAMAHHKRKLGHTIIVPCIKPGSSVNQIENENENEAGEATYGGAQSAPLAGSPAFVFVFVLVLIFVLIYS